MEFNKLSASLSYDVNISTLARASKAMGGLELALSYRGLYRSENSSGNRMRCPVGLH
jgi:hypothetical protein